MGDRKSGILLPVSSLPSNYGVGDFGKSSFEFIYLLKESGFTIWQILPLNPLGYGNSPYQPYSSKAMDDLYVSLDLLQEEGLINKVKPFNKNSDSVDFENVRIYKQKYLKEAFKKFVKDEGFYEFIKFDWVYNYAVFLTLKKKNNLDCWNTWENKQKNWAKDKKFNVEQYNEDIEFEMFIQYTLYKQWMSLKEYANNNGISIMGDMPIYVGIDSDDVWFNQKMFLLDKDGRPTFIAGVPPDYFSETGQRWGNPIYNWNAIEKDDFKFWIDRLKYNSKLFDTIRIDHFRAFDTYWKIPSSCPTAVEGKWIKAPGYEFFDKVFEKIEDIDIVVEDLGDLRKEVLTLRDHYNFKGMRILQFSFDIEKNENDKENLIIYTGTHDNQTIKGWYNSLSKKEKSAAREYLDEHGYDYGSIGLDFVAMILDSYAEIAIAPIVDILNLDDDCRINTPGTVGNPNWQFKLKSFEKLRNLVPTLKEMNENYYRGM